jgi:hypothetical protein
MKLSLLLSLLTTFVSLSPMVPSSHPAKTKAAQALAARLMDALKQSSSARYIQLIPSLNELKKQMHDHADVYKEHLAEAEADFAKEYTVTIVPQTQRAFENLLAEGASRGIRWSEISFVGWEAGKVSKDEWEPVPFTIAFEANGKIFKVEITRAFFLNGQWRASPFVRLV